MFFRVDPERRSRRAAPAESSRRADVGRFSRTWIYGERQPEALPFRQRGAEVRKRAEMIAAHQFDRFASQNAHSIVQPVIEQHRVEMREVLERGGEPCSAQEQHGLLFKTLLRRRRRTLNPAALFWRIERREPAPLLFRDIKRRVFHAERPKNPLL